MSTKGLIRSPPVAFAIVSATAFVEPVAEKYATSTLPVDLVVFV